MYCITPFVLFYWLYPVCTFTPKIVILSEKKCLLITFFYTLLLSKWIAVERRIYTSVILPRVYIYPLKFDFFDQKNSFFSPFCLELSAIKNLKVEPYKKLLFVSKWKRKFSLAPNKLKVVKYYRFLECSFHGIWERVS